MPSADCHGELTEVLDPITLRVYGYLYAGCEVAAYGANGRYTGVRALWIKVIIRAVFDWVQYRKSPNLTKRRWAQDAFVWLFKQNVFFNGFDNVCFNLDVNPEVVRAWAQRLTPRQVVKIELLERFRSGGQEVNPKILAAYALH